MRLFATLVLAFAGALAVVDAPGGPIAVLDTHLDHTGEDIWRAQEIAGVLRVARAADLQVMPMLIGGDFNARPESGVHQQLRDAGFRDAWAGCGGGDALTFPAAAPNRRIDYLYVTGATRCESARVLPSQASDHRPVLFRLRLR
jgi:endonuclease/exonuclease/phosphatase (EEP) superfamily protein YafD